jgi:mono/diheme cytochrome c family protein
MRGRGLSRSLCIGVMLATVMFAAAARGADLAQAGAQIFEAQCAPCHGRPIAADGSTILGPDRLPILPASAGLAIKYRGSEVSPYIEERPDLANAAVLRVFLRNGSLSMPPFRKSELPDSSIDAIAAYIAVKSKAKSGRKPGGSRE